jgi:hypothetical protein
MAYLRAGEKQRGKQTLEEARHMDATLPEAAAAQALVSSLGSK